MYIFSVQDSVRNARVNWSGRTHPCVHKEQMEKKARMQYYEKGEEYVKRKWKEKYGDDDVDAVLEYK